MYGGRKEEGEYSGANVETTSLLRERMEMRGVVRDYRELKEEVDIRRRLPKGSAATAASHISFLIAQITRRKLIPPAAYKHNTHTHVLSLLHISRRSSFLFQYTRIWLFVIAIYLRVFRAHSTRRFGDIP